MIRLKHILAPVDFSPCSEVALRYAAEFALQFEADLRLFHVVQYPLTVGPEEWNVPLEEFEANLQDAARQHLEQVKTDPLTDQQRIHREVRMGSPTAEIVRAAREYEIDLIVLGTHGRSGLKHVLLGSVAENVVRQAPCPVLTVRHPEHEFVMP